MRKIIFLYLLMISVVSYAKTTPEIYEVYDLKGNKLLMSKSDNEVHSMASLTKLMTAYVFLKYYPKNIDKCVTHISDQDNDTIKHTHTRIEKNKAISCENLIAIMLLVSDNYAASAIARSIPNMTKEQFFDLMNKEANRLGMKNTYYKDSSGLSFENKTTAIDLLKLTKEIMKDEKMKKLASIYGLELDTGEKKLYLKTVIN